MADDGTDDRAARVRARAGRRGRGRQPHERRGAARVPRQADRPGQGRERPVLAAPEGHDDEGVRPDHLRPRGARLLSQRSSPTTARRWPRPAAIPTTASAPCSRRRSRSRAEERKGSRGRDQPGPRQRPGARHGRFGQRHHQPPRPQRRDHRRLDAGHDPQLRPHVGTRRQRRPTRSPSFPTAATPASTRS